jgi:hypothetical protein
LEDDVGGDLVTLSLEKMTCPEDVAGFIVKADEFALGGAF